MSDRNQDAEVKMETKKCIRCHEENPLSEFPKDKQKKSGYRAECKVCHNKRNGQLREINKDKIDEKHRQWREENKDRKIKECVRCQEEKPLSEFNEDKSKKDGYRPECKACRLPDIRQYTRENKDNKAEYDRQYRRENKDEIGARQKQYWGSLPGAVYQIKNIINGKIYIGCTTTYQRRRNQHRSNLKINTHRNKRLQEDYNTFGLEAFEFSVIKEFPSDTPLEVLEVKETQLIFEQQRKGVDLYNINVRMGSLANLILEAT